MIFRASSHPLPPRPLLRRPSFTDLFVQTVKYSVTASLRNFMSSRRAPAVQYVLMEFYAPWCPHCQHFAPDLERLGYVFNSRSKRTNVLVTRVNCYALQSVFHTFLIRGFPTLYFGDRHKGTLHSRLHSGYSAAPDARPGATQAQALAPCSIFVCSAHLHSPTATSQAHRRSSNSRTGCRDPAVWRRCLLRTRRTVSALF